MSFVCDTGAPMGFYLSSMARNKLINSDRIQEDETGNEYVMLNGGIGKAAVESTPDGPANIIGLRVLMKLELAVNRDGTKQDARSIIMYLKGKFIKLEWHG